MSEQGVSERAAHLNKLREQILGLVEEFCAEQFPARDFIAGETQIPVSGKVFDGADMRNLVDCSLDFWLTTGRFATAFEKRFARLYGVRAAILVNSGSSANLVALTSLTSVKLGDRRLKPGDGLRPKPRSRRTRSSGQT